MQRIFSKKGLLRLTGGYILLLLIFGFLNEKMLRDVVDMLFMLLALLGGGYLISLVYSDDISAKTLPSLIGFGIKRSTIVIAKFIINTLFACLMFFGTALVVCLALKIGGNGAMSEITTDILTTAALRSLKFLAFSSIVSVLVYGTQKAVVSVVAYIILATSIVTSLLQSLFASEMVINAVGNLSQYMIDPIIIQFLTSPSVSTVVPYVMYVVLFTVLAIIAFCKKELEF